MSHRSLKPFEAETVCLRYERHRETQTKRPWTLTPMSYPNATFRQRINSRTLTSCSRPAALIVVVAQLCALFTGTRFLLTVCFVKPRTHAPSDSEIVAMETHCLDIVQIRLELRTNLHPASPRVARRAFLQGGHGSSGSCGPAPGTNLPQYQHDRLETLRIAPRHTFRCLQAGRFSVIRLDGFSDPSTLPS